MSDVISSAQNPKIKHLLALQQKSSLRRSEGLFVVEGRRELEHCIHSGFNIHSIFTTDDCSSFPTTQATVYQVSPNVYERIAYRGSTEGIVALVRTPAPRTLQSLLPKDRSEVPLFVILESVEKPGNLGAVLRSADAAQASGVIVCDPLTDLYNPNLIRSSIGSIFTVPTVSCTTDECIAFLKEHGIQILTAQLQDSHLYYATDMTVPTAIVMGTESTGLTDAWRKAADAHIRIPMKGQLDSLNVSVSAAILLYEAVRQRES